MPALRSGRLAALAVLCLLTLSATACSRSDAGSAGAQAAPAGNGAGGGQRPEQPAVPVAVAPAAVGSIASTYKATATLEAEKEAQVLARVTGVVRSLAAEEGDLVQAGAPLLVIENDEYRYRVEQAEAAAANLRARFERLEQMMQEQLATEEEFQAARSELATAEADLGLAKLNLSYTTVAAPFTGRVTQRLVDVGQNLSTGDAVFVMADFDPLLARVHVPSREFNRLQKDQAVELVLDSSGERLSGRITLVSPVIDPTSGTIKLTVEVPAYPAGTRPGDFAQVQIITERRDGATLVPRGAVLTDKGETVVYTVAGDAERPVAERRIVEVGFTDDDNAQITAGLAVGEQVVVRGQRSLKHGMPLKILGDGAEAGANS
jgi:membrane fusion protein (multidrug efflux system)